MRRIEPQRLEVTKEERGKKKAGNQAAEG